jgi:hypothetical protein
VSLLYVDLPSFRYMPKISISRSYGSSNFSFLRSLHNDFHSGCNSVLPTSSVFLSPTSLSSFVVVGFLGENHFD